MTWITLITAGALWTLGTGRFSLAAAMWAAPILLLRFTESQPPWSAFLIVALTLALALGISLRSQVPLPPLPYAALVSAMGLMMSVPFLIHAWIGTDGLVSTLAYPAAWVVLELAMSRWSPYGTWGSLAYSQAGSLPLRQLLRWTGFTGITFLLSWAGAVGAWLWRNGFDPARVWPEALVPAAVFAGILLGGELRLRFAKPSRTVRIASITEPRALGERMIREVAGPMIAGKAVPLDVVRANASECLRSLFESSEAQARAGAKIVFWSEMAAVVAKSDEGELHARAARLARDHGIYLGIAYAALHPELRKFENTFALFDPRGRAALKYHKARPVPGPEAARTLAPTDREGSKPKVVDTPYGRIGALICFDANFPSLARDLKRQGAEILLLPSSDWKEIDPLHTEMALFRAVENGMSVVRQARLGLSKAVDPWGRTLASVDYFEVDQAVMVCEVPASGKWGD